MNDIMDLTTQQKENNRILHELLTTRLATGSSQQGPRAMQDDDFKVSDEALTAPSSWPG